MREVGWVIFDEIHYMRDPGTVLAYMHVPEHYLWCRKMIAHNCVMIAIKLNVLPSE